jgi:predicted membrane protein
MRISIAINNFVVGIPVFFGLLGLVENSLWFIAALSTMLTGFAQLIIAVNYLIQFYKDKGRHIYYYFSGVLLFFILWMSPLQIDFIWIIPPILAIYLTYILYRKQNAFNNEP